MNQPEGYVLVQIKQLAQWREWANNVAAWSKQADRSSEVARLKASISSAMIAATIPPASAAGEQEALRRIKYEAVSLAEPGAAPSPSAVQPLSEARIDDEFLYGTSRTKIPMAAFMQGVRFAERHYGIVTPKEQT